MKKETIQPLAELKTGDCFILVNEGQPNTPYVVLKQRDRFTYIQKPSGRNDYYHSCIEVINVSPDWKGEFMEEIITN